MELDKYTELNILGEGSYGIVYKCQHKQSKAIVAIKKIKNSSDYDSQKIFHRELKVLKELKHKNIVRLLEATKKRNIIYLVFEYVENTLLQEVAKYCGGMDDALVSTYLNQILSAIRYMHIELGIIHRDLKPENVLVDGNGIKIADFGFARKLDKNHRYTEYVATRWYRAPELLLSSAYDEKVDIFAIGLIAYEMRTGRPLLPGNSDLDQLILITKLIGGLSSHQKTLFFKNPCFLGIKFPYNIALPMYHKLPQFSLEFKEFLDAALAVDPEKRESADELLHLNFVKGFKKYKIRRPFSLPVLPEKQISTGLIVKIN